MIITIDGPAGAGKSTISKQFAKSIGFEVLDTGAMYRCVALLYKRMGLEITHKEFQHSLHNIQIHFKNQHIFLNGEDVSTSIRTPEIDILTSKIISINPSIRKHLVILQRQIGSKQNIVAEGRDMGTNVFTEAPIKFYLTATPKIRAQRRHSELLKKNINKNIDELKKEIELRDHEDSNRQINPLRIPENATIIDTSELSISQVVQQMIDIYTSFKNI